VINNDSNFPKSIDFIVNAYERVCMIIGHQKETYILYEIMNYIITKTENNDENNLIFFSNFDKVIMFLNI